MRIGSSERRKYSSFFDCTSARDDPAAPAMMLWKSFGRNLSQTASESAAKRRSVDTTDILEASGGLVREMISVTHSKGKEVNLDFPVLSSICSDLISLQSFCSSIGKPLFLIYRALLGG